MEGELHLFGYESFFFAKGVGFFGGGSVERVAKVGGRGFIFSNHKVYNNKIYFNAASLC